MIVFLLIGMIFDGLVTGPPYRRLVDFDNFDWFVLMGIVTYGVYNASPHPPMKFQDDILCFGWILEAMTLRLPLLFHPRFSYSKPHGLT